jgi:hypothetical protein
MRCTNHPRNELKTYIVGGDNIASNARRFFKKTIQPAKIYTTWRMSLAEK